MVTVVLADDRDLHRQGLRSTMEVEHELYIADEARDGWEACNKTERLKPDLLVVNLRMPGLSGREIAQRVLDRPTRPNMVIIREDDNLSYVCEAITGGVMGFRMKNSGNEEFVYSIQEILRGRFVPWYASFWSYSA